MVRRRSRVFFPWERRRGPLGLLGRARFGGALGLVLFTAAVWFVSSREHDASMVRDTRAVLTDTTRAIAAYRADHAHGCPRSVGELVDRGSLRELPVDAWGRPLRLTCPGRVHRSDFDLVSDGPDGLPGGLDRVQ